MLNVEILSIPEGDDKPLKYPLMFKVGEVFVFTKMDVAPYFDFDLEKVKGHILKLNKEASFYPVSAKTGEGMEELEKAILNAVREYKK